MPRPLDSTTKSGLQASVVAPVIIVWLDISGDPVFGWNGPGLFAPVNTGDPDLDGQTFLPVDGPVAVSDFTENQSIGEEVQIDMRANDLNAPLLRQIIRDKRAWQGRRGKIWVGLLNEGETQVIGAPFALMNGVMTEASIARKPAEDALFRLAVDTDLSNAKGRAARLVDHARFYPTDTASTRLTQLAKGPITGAFRRGGNGFGGGGSGGRFGGGFPNQRFIP